MKLPTLALSLFLFTLLSCQPKDRLIYQQLQARPQSGAAVTPYPLIFAPRNPDPSRLLVVLHGCAQSAEAMALGTQFNQLADREKVVVLYPEAPAGDPMNCWAWYKPENQRRDSGQLALIANEIDNVKASFHLQGPRVFVVGFSSGGAMVSGLLACYSEMFAGAAIHSGVVYAAAKSEAKAIQVLSKGLHELPKDRECNPHSYTGRLLILQGEADEVVHPSNGTALVSDFTVNREHTDRLYRVNRSDFTVADFGRQPGHVRLISIGKLDHEWSGANLAASRADLLGTKGKYTTILPFFADYGPNATDLIWRFTVDGENTIPDLEPVKTGQLLGDDFLP